MLMLFDLTKVSVLIVNQELQWQLLHFVVLGRNIPVCQNLIITDVLPTFSSVVHLILVSHATLN